MAERVIKTTIALDGEKAFKSAIQSINSEMKVFDSELKLVTAEFGKTDQGMKGLRATAEILSRKVEDQKAKVEALKNAVKDSGDAYDKARNKYAALDDELKKTKEAFGDNSEEARRAAQQLAKASEEVNKAERNYNSYRVQLNNTQVELKQTTQRLEKTAKAAKDLKNIRLKDLMPVEVARNVEKVAKEFEKVAAAAGKAAAAAAKLGAKTIKASFEASTKALVAYSSAASAAATALQAMTAESAVWADDINTLAKQTGISTAELQKMQYAADLIDVDVETISKSMAKLTKNMTSTSASVTGAFETLGVAVRNESGELRNNQDVFSELIIALGTVENETERDSLAMQIFGKSAQELNPLILGGADALKELGKEAEDAGLILSQDALDNLNAYNDSLDKMKANAAAAGNIIATAFAPRLQTISDRIGSSLPNISQAFGKMFSGDLTAGQNFRQQVRKLTDSLTKDINDIFPDFLSGFNTLILSVGENLPSIIVGILPDMIEGLKNLVLGFVEMLPTQLPIIVQAGFDLFSGLIGGLNDVLEKLIPMLPELIRDISEKIKENAPVVIKTGADLLVNLIDGISTAMPELLQQAAELIPVIVKEIASHLPEIIRSGANLIKTFAESFPTAVGYILENIPVIIESIIQGLSEVDWLETAGMVFEGLGKGLIGLFEGALGFIDNLFGTNLKKWYQDITAFWYDAGSKLYQTLHADEIEATETKGKATDLLTKIRLNYTDILRDQFARGEWDIEDALNQAIADNLVSAEDIALYDKYVKEQLLSLYVQNAEELQEALQNQRLTSNRRGGMPTNVPAENVTNINYAVNYNKPATPHEIAQDKEAALEKENLYR